MRSFHSLLRGDTEKEDVGMNTEETKFEKIKIKIIID